MKYLLIFLSICFFSSGLYADTTFVSGTIINETWTSSGSPYCVTGDILIAGLVIETSVNVIFLGDYIFEVAGILTANGTEQDSIKFTKADSIDSWKGIIFQNSLPGSEMSWCIVENANTSGIRIIESFPSIDNCIIRNNQSAEHGGGLHIYLSTTGILEISNCNIIGNKTPTNHTVPVSNGAGIWVNAVSGTVRFVNCKIENNQATRNDGHVYGGGGWVNGEVEFKLCTIEDNLVRGQDNIPGGSSAGRGGGIYIEDGSINFINTVISTNTARGYAQGGMSGNAGYASGGGVHINNGQINFFNSVISSNIASGTHGTQGGGIYIDSGLTVIENNALAWNNVQAIENNTASVNVVNSIIYFNNSSNTQIEGNVSATFSDIEGGFPGEGNINFNPIFFSDSCLQIVIGSPCIDAGNPDSNYNDVCYPPSLGTERNDIGAHGGPNACDWGDGCSVTDIGNEIINIPEKYLLEQNYPNPFNPSTKVKYLIPEMSFVTLKVFDVLGNEIAALVNEEKPAGSYEVNFNARDLSSGIYFYKLNTGSFIETKKMILLR